MPRKLDLSWQMRSAIWDFAASLGRDKIGRYKISAIERSLHQLEESYWQEAVPDKRTIKKVIGELDSLPISTLMTLPKHVWVIREDYREIESSLEARASGGRIPRSEASPTSNRDFGHEELEAVTEPDHPTKVEKMNKAILRDGTWSIFWPTEILEGYKKILQMALGFAENVRLATVKEQTLLNALENGEPEVIGLRYDGIHYAALNAL